MSKIADDQIEAGARALAKFWGYNWECICSEERGLDCDCGDAMQEERVDHYDDTPSRRDCRDAALAVLAAIAKRQIEERSDTATAEHSSASLTQKSETPDE
jgi:hypothetical protein